ncbi:MAG: hypothetical protein ACYS8Z_12600, partial [Planctomycetota bacterium]
MMRKLILVYLWLLLWSVCGGRTITVDDDGPANFATIQAAIDAADHADVIVVAPGTYRENIHLKGKAI